MQAKTLRLPATLAALTALAAASPAAAKYVSGHQVAVNQTTYKMTGDLLGDWKVTGFKILSHNPLFFAKGTERFTGCIDRHHDGSCAGDPTGTLRFTFRYWSKMAGGKTEQLGTCSHRLVEATGGLAGTTGFIMMVDTPNHSGHGVTTRYEGEISMGNATGARARASAARPC
jgi:hypothetical protein